MGHTVNIDDIKNAITIYGAPAGLKRCFTNLIENALRYGKIAKIALYADERNAIITISDEGPGIPESEHTEIFKPFYRTPIGKELSSTSSGLGLSIVADIVKYHDGNIKLANLPGRGLMVSVIMLKSDSSGMIET